MKKIGTLYLDMDGVIADFFPELVNFYKAKFPHIQHWKDIPSTEDIVKGLSGTDFFYRLPIFPTTKKLLKLIHEMTKGNWSILSTPLKGDERNSIYWKNRWLDKLLEDKELIGVKPQTRNYSHHKFLYAKTHSLPNLLIDDRPQNIEWFIEKGGKGIRYQANESKWNKLITKLEKEIV